MMATGTVAVDVALLERCHASVLRLADLIEIRDAGDDALELCHLIADDLEQALGVPPKSVSA